MANKPKETVLQTLPPKKKKKRKKETANKEKPVEDGQNKKRDRRNQEKKPLPPELLAFSYENKDRITTAEENCPKTKNGPFTVAVTVATGSKAKNNLKIWELGTLLSEQLREFATRFGCAKTGSMTKFQCRLAIARQMTMGDYYQSRDVPNPHSSNETKKINTQFRILNACIMPEFIDRFVQLNNIKNRKDFESAPGGGNPLHGSAVKRAVSLKDVA